MKQLLQISCLVAMLAGFASGALGGNLEDGFKAAESGDFKNAYRLWLLEAEQGNASAQCNLGVLYAEGQGVSQDDKTALQWFHLAAAQGDAKAQTNLGILYASGRGVSQDDREAAKWFHLAALQGDAKAQFSLGVMYDVGRGVTQNQVIACAWYALAAERGIGAAQNYRAAIQKNMTLAEIEMSEQIAEQIRSEIGN